MPCVSFFDGKNQILKGFLPFHSITGLYRVFSNSKGWRRDTQPNGTQHNDTQHNDIQHNDTQHNDTQHNWIICNTQHRGQSA